MFSWHSSAGNATNFPNALGQESLHADEVGRRFYGGTNGVAPGVAHVDGYEATHFFNLIQLQAAITGRVVNQSFTFGSQEPVVDAAYDTYAARFGTIFVSGVGNGGAVSSPATAYNGLGCWICSARIVN